MDGDLSTVRLSLSFDIIYNFELAFQCHRFEVNQHLVAEVMSVLLKSGQSVSREEAVEKMNLGEKGGTPSESSWNSIDSPVRFRVQIEHEPRNLHVSSILDHHVLNLICQDCWRELTADLGD
ncbi:hypothetical protein DY000_02053063 [Brassica cretica]|uniref:Uncharacterized protein n=1 Tax=Brassica cretica TaxID=69181 RepID=A0ABQ7A8U8_BRACR|nr:hypothetical protein DY000_02053063 [Brassica cretica]